MDSRKFVFKETGIVAIGVVICDAVMLGIFALLHHFDVSVLLGSLIGSILAIGNFFFMAVSASLASDKAMSQDVTGGKALMKSSYLLRIVLIFVILFACVKSGLCNVLSSVLPLLFVRPTLTVAEFFRKSGEAKS